MSICSGYVLSLSHFTETETRHLIKSQVRTAPQVRNVTLQVLRTAVQRYNSFNCSLCLFRFWKYCKRCGVGIIVAAHVGLRGLMWRGGLPGGGQKAKAKHKADMNYSP